MKAFLVTKDLLDEKLAMFITRGTVLTDLLRHSPFETHRRVFRAVLPTISRDIT